MMNDERITVDEWKKRPQASGGSSAPGKFGNVPMSYKSKIGHVRTYASRAEKAHAEQLDLMMCSATAGPDPGSRSLISWLPQVRFDLPGGERHYVDFMLLWSDGRVTFEEVKGKETPKGRLKRKMVEHLYGIKVQVIPNRPGVGR